LQVLARETFSVSTQTRAAVIRRLAQDSKWVTADARTNERFAANERKLTRIKRAGERVYDADGFHAGERYSVDCLHGWSDRRSFGGGTVRVSAKQRNRGLNEIADARLARAFRPKCDRLADGLYVS
jgi:hypothetical protein